MRRHELSDEEWAIIQPLLPNKPRGVPRVDDRRVLNGILWRFRTGAPWRDIPERSARGRSSTTGSSAGGRRGCGTVSSPPYQRLATATS
jgi:transposase